MKKNRNRRLLIFKLNLRSVVFICAVSLIFTSFEAFRSNDKDEEGFVKIFDGNTFIGWEGDTIYMWKIDEGSIVGGSLENGVPHNDFLSTKRLYKNFILKLKFKLEGTPNMNAGVQFRSRRLYDPEYEMIGYQADIADGAYGSLYDESRRKNYLCGNKFENPNSIVNMNGWNDMEIKANGRRIEIFINGKQTVDYMENDLNIAQDGVIGLQIHGGAEALASYKDIRIKELL